MEWWPPYHNNAATMGVQHGYNVWTQLTQFTMWEIQALTTIVNHT